MLIIYYLKNYKTEQIGSHCYKNDINMYMYMYTHMLCIQDTRGTGGHATKY